MIGLRRLVIQAAAWLAFGLGAIGIFVPGLPTTIFWILAALAFMRTNPRMYSRIVGHARFGQPIRRFIEHGTIGSRARSISIGSMAASAILCLLFMPGLWAKVLTVAFIAIGIGWIATLPSPDARPTTPLQGSLAESETPKS